MSEYNAGEEAKALIAVLTQYLDLETALQNAYDQGVSDTVETGARADFFE